MKKRRKRLIRGVDAVWKRRVKQAAKCSSYGEFKVRPGLVGRSPNLMGLHSTHTGLFNLTSIKKGRLENCVRACIKILLHLLIGVTLHEPLLQCEI